MTPSYGSTTAVTSSNNFLLMNKSCLTTNISDLSPSTASEVPLTLVDINGVPTHVNSVVTNGGDTQVVYINNGDVIASTTSKALLESGVLSTLNVHGMKSSSLPAEVSSSTDTEVLVQTETVKPKVQPVTKIGEDWAIVIDQNMKGIEYTFLKYIFQMNNINIGLHC